MTTPKNIKIVIGANFGDEGKGLMTDYFCQEAAQKGEKALVICHNGGSQRGHTVIKNDKPRHVFHHFGAGSFSGADTYLAEEFIVNPMVFRKEWEELKKADCTPTVFAHPNCRITTPFDMIINQLTEEKRQDQRHGSCGMGIYETISRHREMKKNGQNLTLKTLYQEGRPSLQKIRDEYFPRRLETLKLTMDKEWEAIISSDNLLDHYLEDLTFMCQNLRFTEVSIFDHYNTLVFEGGQGLLLDQDNQEYFPHLTPSSTGVKNPKNLIQKWLHSSPSPSLNSASPLTSIEVCYVTRPYLTRHGAGRFDTECKKEEINPHMTDLTNVPNPYQGTLRYGKMDVQALQKRIQNDFIPLQKTIPFQTCQCSLAITHRNEHKDPFVIEKSMDIQSFFAGFNKIYHSYGEDALSVNCAFPSILVEKNFLL